MSIIDTTHEAGFIADDEIISDSGDFKLISPVLFNQVEYQRGVHLSRRLTLVLFDLGL